MMEYELLGPRVQFLTKATDLSDFALFKGYIPPGSFVGLHAHEDHETFFLISGALEFHVQGAWTTVRAGEVVDVPGNAKHAFRNPFAGEAVCLTVATQKLCDFLVSVGRDPKTVVPGPPPSEAIDHFVNSARAAGYWLAGPEENHAIGLPPKA